MASDVRDARAGERPRIASPVGRSNYVLKTLQFETICPTRRAPYHKCVNKLVNRDSHSWHALRHGTFTQTRGETDASVVFTPSPELSRDGDDADAPVRAHGSLAGCWRDATGRFGARCT